MKFTKEEAKLLKELLDAIKVDATNPNALEAVKLVQSTVKKVEALTESGKPETAAG